MNRTGSIGSRVPPALTTTRRPARSHRVRPAATASARNRTAAPGSRPAPTWPLARRPASGSTTANPNRRSAATFSPTAGLAHIASFMAGATTTGQRAASTVAATRSSACPWVRRATRSAVAGATSATRAQSPSSTCGSGGPSAANRSVWTGRPVRPWNVAGPTNRVAAAVIATRTSHPAWTSRETTSATLYAAMPPDTSTATRRPRTAAETSAGSSGLIALPAPAALALQDREDLPHGPLCVVVHHDVIVFRRKAHLDFGQTLPRLHDLGSLAAAPCPAPQQLLHRRRADEHGHGIGTALTHLLGALHFDLEDHVPAAVQRLRDAPGRSPVEVSVDARMLQQLALGDETLERGLVDEGVVLALHLVVPAGPRGVRDRVRQPGVALAQHPDQGVFADAARPG